MSKLKEAILVISQLLEKEHSRANTELINDYIGEDPVRVKALIQIVCTDKKKLHQRGSYVIWMMHKKKADLLVPHLDQLLELLPNPSHESFARALTVILFTIDIPEKYLGQVADYCFAAFENPNSAIAIRVNAMSVLANICEKEPELVDELEMLIHEYEKQGTAAYKSRSKKVLKQLAKIRKNTQS